MVRWSGIRTRYYLRSGNQSHLKKKNDPGVENGVGLAEKEIAAAFVPKKKLSPPDLV